jgi:hypothetical protein
MNAAKTQFGYVLEAGFGVVHVSPHRADTEETAQFRRIILRHVVPSGEIEILIRYPGEPTYGWVIAIEYSGRHAI